jgi:membrane protein implicated in regulation of membrane protease activity
MEGADVRRLSLPELTVHLTEQVKRLLRAQMALARAELFARSRQAVLGGGLLAAAALVGLGGWLALVAAAVAGIAEALPVWASALIVGAALTAIAAVLALAGRGRVRRGMPPLAVTADSVRGNLHQLTGRPQPNGKAELNGKAGVR